jgi:hypothetical protein
MVAPSPDSYERRSEGLVAVVKVLQGHQGPTSARPQAAFNPVRLLVDPGIAPTQQPRMPHATQPVSAPRPTHTVSTQPAGRVQDDPPMPARGAVGDGAMSTVMVGHDDGGPCAYRLYGCDLCRSLPSCAGSCRRSSPSRVSLYIRPDENTGWWSVESTPPSTTGANSNCQGPTIGISRTRHPSTDIPTLLAPPEHTF